MTKKVKNFIQAPLPFQGQKRRFLKPFKECLNSFQPDAVYIDLFGGSGLLAHTVKQQYPNARVIWNDFDNYQKRLLNIDTTNELIADLRVILKDYPRDQRITGLSRENVLKRIKQAEKEGYVDYITISSSILFSAKYVISFESLIKETLYNNIKKSNYEVCNYLEGVERIQCDYKQLHSKFKDFANVVWLIDPPYLSTDTTTYNSDSYWRLKDYLDVLNVLEGANYFYFTSNKSQIVELCEWFETRSFQGNPFAGGITMTVDASINKQAKYTDIMIYDYKKSRD